MSPRRNTRPTLTKSSPDTPHSSRDTSLDTMLGNPLRGAETDQASGSPTGRQTEATESQRPTVQVSEIASATAISDGSLSVSLDNYYLSPELVPLLSEPDATSGIRTFKTRTYVELAEGGTVLLGRDSEQNYRARSGTELVASGPRLEQVEGSLLWRRLAHRETQQGDFNLPPTRAFRKNWGVDPRFTLSELITINNVHYKVVTRSDARESPITYIQSPAHPIYDFDLLEATLRHMPDEQPRGAIQVPPDNHWEIDARLPFEKTLTAYVRDFFPEVTTVTLENIARRQFELSNDSPFADSSG